MVLNLIAMANLIVLLLAINSRLLNVKGVDFDHIPVIVVIVWNILMLLL